MDFISVAHCKVTAIWECRSYPEKGKEGTQNGIMGTTPEIIWKVCGNALNFAS